MERISYDNFVKWKDKIRKGDSFLDIGCWSGATVLELSRKCDAYGMDFNKKTLELADGKIKDKLTYCDITKDRPFDKKFDWVLFSEVIEHIEKEDEAIKNVSDCIKKGGKLILTTPKSVAFFEFWDPAWVRWKFGGKERHHHYTLDELSKKLSKYGLRVKVYAIRGNFSWVIRRWINVTLKYFFKSEKTIRNSWSEGFTDFMILAEKI